MALESIEIPIITNEVAGGCEASIPGAEEYSASREGEGDYTMEAIIIVAGDVREQIKTRAQLHEFLQKIGPKNTWSAPADKNLVVRKIDLNIED